MWRRYSHKKILMGDRRYCIFDPRSKPDDLAKIMQRTKNKERGSFSISVLPTRKDHKLLKPKTVNAETKNEVECGGSEKLSRYFALVSRDIHQKEVSIEMGKGIEQDSVSTVSEGSVKTLTKQKHITE